METAEKLLIDVKNIIKINEEEINKTGKGFNLISLLGMENNERYCHSNIIAELLKNDGSHTYGNKFLLLFLKEVGIVGFDVSNYEVLTEEYVGEVKCGEEEKMRTFLDVVIKDKTTGKVILIENKIWAPDQFEQLDRYYEYYKGKIIKLFYLNVFQFDYEFSLESLESELNYEQEIKLEDIKKVYKSITYETQIKNWLANCIVASTEKPFVSRQIETYYQTILKISKQDIYKNMNTELENLIIKSKEDFFAAEEITKHFVHLSNIIKPSFLEKVKSIIPLNGSFKKEENTLYYIIDEDENYLFIGFQYYDKNMLLIKNDEIFNRILEKLQVQFPLNKFHKGNDWWNGWFSLSTKSIFSNNLFKNLDANLKFAVLNNIDEESKIVAQEFLEILEEFKKLLEE